MGTILKPNNVSVYACGGCGINIVSTMQPPSLESGQAQTSFYAIDTSRSNLRNAKFDETNTYLFDGTNGSGKERGENLDLIVRSAKQILQRFTPGDFNIVVHSGGGGSGGVIGAALVSEMMSEGVPVVAIVVGSTDSQVEVANTIKTLQTYDVFAQENAHPVVVHYLENSAVNGASRRIIDAGAHSAIHALLLLFSGLNDEMDSADVRNWIKHAGSGEVFALQFCPTPEAYAKAGTVISAATLAKRDALTSLEPAPAYQAVGYVTSEPAIAGIEHALHFTLSGNLIDESLRALNKRSQDNQKRLASVIKRDPLADNNKPRGSGGIIA